MKKQSTGILEILSNTQKPFLGKLIQYLPNTETRNSLENISNVAKSFHSQISLSSTKESFLEKFIGRTSESLKSFSNTQETCISKILKVSTQCGYVRSTGGGAAN